MCLVYAVGMVGKSGMIKNIEGLIASKLSYRCNHCLGKICSDALTCWGTESKEKKK